MSILIYTCENDPQVDTVIEMLNNHKVVRLNSEEIFRHLDINISLSHDAISHNIAFPRSGISFDINEIKSVWWRKPYKFSTYPEYDYSTSERLFIRSTASNFIGNLIALLRDSYWINHPGKNKDANLKLDQLARAREIGFIIPSTLVTTSKIEAYDFFCHHDSNVIAKSLTDPYIGRMEADFNELENNLVNNSIFLTTKLTEQSFKDMDSIKIAPMILQYCIKKQYELRVTVVEDEIFCAKLDSQSDTRTETDWRVYQALNLEMRHDYYDIPDNLRKKILEFVRSYGLSYSALDFIVDEDGKYVFVENNPNGQFGWIEYALPRLHISKSIANNLMKHDK